MYVCNRTYIFIFFSTVWRKITAMLFFNVRPYYLVVVVSLLFLIWRFFYSPSSFLWLHNSVFDFFYQYSNNQYTVGLKCWYPLKTVAVVFFGFQRTTIIYRYCMYKHKDVICVNTEKSNFFRVLERVCIKREALQT